MAAVVNGLLATVAMTSSELCGRTFVQAHVRLSFVSLMSTLDITHMINVPGSYLRRAW